MSNHYFMCSDVSSFDIEQLKMGHRFIIFISTINLFSQSVQSQYEDAKICVNDKEFTLHTQLSTFKEADNYCKARGKSLLLIKSSLVQGIITTQLASLEKSFRSPQNISFFGYWLGGTRKADTKWVWMDGTLIPTKKGNEKAGYSNWLLEQPIPRGFFKTAGRGTCLLFVTISDGKPSPLFNRNWQAGDCSSKKYFFCQKDISQSACIDVNVQGNLSTFSRVLLFFCVLFLVLVLVMGLKIFSLNRRLKVMIAKRILNDSSSQASRTRPKTFQNERFVARSVASQHPITIGMPFGNMDDRDNIPSYIELHDPNPIRPKNYRHATRTLS